MNAITTPSSRTFEIPRGAFQHITEIFTIAAIPATFVICALTHTANWTTLTVITAAAALLNLGLSIERSRAGIRRAIGAFACAALAIVGRIIFAAAPSFKPVSAIAIAAGASFGRQAGFFVGAMAALVTNFYFGQGMWTPWQMYAWGLLGWGAGMLANTKIFQHATGICAYGFAACMLYGVLMNSASLLAFSTFGVHGVWQALAFYAASVPFDLVHAAATVAFLIALYVPFRKLLQTGFMHA